MTAAVQRHDFPRNAMDAFRLTAPAEVDGELTAWLAEAYETGTQQHLRR